jgi:cyclopropane-fatty-acyl-phospholipid synthase
MGLLAKVTRETPVEISADFLEHLFAGYPRRDFLVRFWDGSSWGAANQPRFTLVLRHPGALRAMFLNPSELTLGEAYIYNDFDIEGDIEAALEMGEHLLSQDYGLGERLHLGNILGKLPPQGRPRAILRPRKLRGAVHSKSRDRQAVTYHYDLPAEFYRLFLDRRMIYSCAYFQHLDESLDAAQEHKLDYLCRKLRLRPGERLLDIGCGWGALIIHAAAHYGVQALGVTLSEPQAELARQRIREAGLEDKCSAKVRDYRDLDGREQFDKIVSVGMFEHVGEALLPEYFTRAWRLLQPGGVFLNHGIAYSAIYHRRGLSFVDRYVFPDGDMVPINTSLHAAEHSGFEVRDVESLREHYALTLHHWVQRLEGNAEQARSITDDTTYRIWRLYMTGSAHAFRTGRLNLYQALLAKPAGGRSGLPLTRGDWYCSYEA